MKHLEIADFHFSSKWADHSVQCGHAVARAARDHAVDLITVPGDWFDGPMYASDRGGLAVAKAIMKECLDVAPVVAIEGTPSHDAPGCYEIFREMGLVLLKPGKLYHYVKGLRAVIEVEPTTAPDDPTAILFGIPELSKRTIQAQLNLPAEQANAAAERLLADYVEQFIAPNRARFPDIPAIGLIHGNLSDDHRDNETDIILKASDIVIHTEDLRPANLDRWAAGHIHAPWESHVVSCGYAGFTGMDSNPWGKTGFLPSMNLVEINGPGDVSVDRIAYGTPERRKVYSVADVMPMEPDVAWWVEMTDHDAVLPEGLHPWSRLTVKEDQTETRRVSQEQAAEVQTLWDLFKLIDPDVNPELKAKVDEITETVKPVQIEQKNVAVTYVEIAGCILFKGRTVRFDMSNLADGLTLITGQNGDGKSSLLSFCSPYPVIIGKDTKSGRDSAIKDFFSGRESYIKKTVIKNGVKHDHLITIKAAHTKNPKTECYLTINGEPQLDKGTFDEMMTACEGHYGSIHDYRITTFCEQPNQASANLSGLMSAKPIDARNIVQAIAGVDRDRERRYALDRVGECQIEAEQCQFKADALEEQLSDADFPALIEAKKQESAAVGEKVKQVHSDGELLAARVAQMEEDARACDERDRLTGEITADHERLAWLESVVSTLVSNELAIKEDDESIQWNNEISAKEGAMALAQSRYETALSVYQAACDHNERAAHASRELEECRAAAKRVPELESLAKRDGEYRDAQADILRIRSQIEVKEERIQSMTQPCEHCGKLPSAAESMICTLNEEIISLRGAIDALAAHKPVEYNPDDLARCRHMAGRIPELTAMAVMKPVSKPEPPEVVVIGERRPTMAPFERETIMEQISRAKGAFETMSVLKESISLKTKQAAAITAERPLTLDIDRAMLTELRTRFTDLKVELQRINGEIERIQDEQDHNERLASQIAELREKAKATGVEDWTYIASMLAANKIPALELDLVLDVIDAEATDCIEPFLEGRYSIETLTQEEGKKGLVDRFDIIVHDREEGSELSLFSFNPGHKAFFSDAYIKALILQRNQRLKRSYSPVIFDEADSPIKESRIGMYYQINQAYYRRHASRVLVVSQKDSASAYMAGEVDVNGLKED